MKLQRRFNNTIKYIRNSAIFSVFVSDFPFLFFLMKSSYKSKPQITNYLLLPLAIIQSEIFWFYSVVYCLLLDSTKIQKYPTPLHQELRHRSISDPQIIFHKEVNNDDITKLTEEERNIALRRESLPLPVLKNIRHRPSIHDELNGTTCPPVWWQKTRIKFGHTPVRVDVIIESENDDIDALSSLPNSLSPPTIDDIFNDEPTPISRTSSISNSFVHTITKPLSVSSISSIFTPTHSPKSSFSSTSKRSFTLAEASPPLSPQSSTAGSFFKPKSKKKFKLMLKKLNNGLHHISGHRKNSSSDMNKF
jgi:hypothetical protein